MDVQLQIPDILRPPASQAALDIDMWSVEDLFMRRAVIADRSTTARMAQELGLHGKIILEAFEQLRARHFLDVLKLEGNDYHFMLTATGREYALSSSDRCSYAGIAPVSMDRYTTVTMMLKAETKVKHADVVREFSDLVLNRKIIERIGPAFSAQQSIFFYGPSGTGKTSLAERLVRLYDDWIVVPYAIEIDRQFISVYDPTVHKAVTPQPPGFDKRWVVCERPFVIAGGELDLSMLQLKRDPISKVYGAPLQLKANGGIFLIDDFGRQMVQPGALLNRWIIPLERRVDFLALDSGLKFQVPFEVLVVFSTNIDPAKLGDEAFFRRIQNKIFIGATSTEEFDEILTRSAARFGVAIDEDSHQMVRLVCREFGRGRTYPSYPVDLVKLVKSICEYEGIPLEITRSVLWRAAELYFTSAAAAGEWNSSMDPAEAFTSASAVAYQN
jgi:hypothetical protein